MNADRSTDIRMDSLPGMYADQAFWGLTLTQFLGAFNDNFFKQLMLLLAVPVAAAAGSATEEDAQGTATIVFSLPFVLFSGLAGFLADRYSKQRVIILSKILEIIVMAWGVAAFLCYDATGYRGLLVVLFAMGAQSAFFGPGKYGILPELFRPTDLPRVNGVILMTTFVAIILGAASAGILRDLVETGPGSAAQLWVGSAICVGIAVLGTLTSLAVRPVGPAKPRLPFRLSHLGVPRETRRLLGQDRPLLGAIAASSVFWLVAGIAIQAINSLGLVQLRLNNTRTSLMTATIGLGIAIGSVLAGILSRGRVNFRIVRAGLWGLLLFLLLMSVTLPGGRHLLGFWGSIPVLAVLGMAAAFFAIPIQVYIQARPPAEQKGRMIGAMNQANFLAIVFSGALYDLFDAIVVSACWPRSFIFAMMALLVVPVLLLYHPKLDDPNNG